MGINTFKIMNKITVFFNNSGKFISENQSCLVTFFEPWAPSLYSGAFSRESKRASVVESRTNQAAEGKAKTDHAKQLVQNILLQRLNNQELPESITNFLIEQWQRVLLLVRLKSGDSSPEWLINNTSVYQDVIGNHAGRRINRRIGRSGLMPYF